MGGLDLYNEYYKEWRKLCWKGTRNMRAGSKYAYELILNDVV